MNAIQPTTTLRSLFVPRPFHSPQHNVEPLQVPADLISSLGKGVSATTGEHQRIRRHPQLSQAEFQERVVGFLPTLSPANQALLTRGLLAPIEPTPLTQWPAILKALGEPVKDYSDVRPKIESLFEGLKTFFGDQPLGKFQTTKIVDPSLYYFFPTEQEIKLPFDLYDQDGRPLSPQEIYQVLLPVVQGHDEFGVIDMLYLSALTLRHQGVASHLDWPKEDVEEYEFAAWRRVMTELQNLGYRFTPTSVDLSQPLTAEMLGLKSFEFAALGRSECQIKTLEKLLTYTPKRLLKDVKALYSSFNFLSVSKIRYALLKHGLFLQDPPPALTKRV